jgi:hypothetical protein
VAGTSEAKKSDETRDSALIVHKGSTKVPIIFLISDLVIEENLVFSPAVQVLSMLLLTFSM